MSCHETRPVGFVTDVVRILLPVLVVLMCIASDSYGLELTGSTRASALVSDNIHRRSSSLEETGTLLEQGVGVQISEDWGRRSFDLSLDGGWETLDSESSISSDEVYRIGLNFTIPWSGLGRIEGTAQASRETATPEADDPDQERVLVKRSEGGILVAEEANAVTGWQARVNRRMEQSSSVDLSETDAGFQWSRGLNPISTLMLQGTSTVGEDEEEMDSWRRIGASVDLDNRPRPNVTRKYTASWERSTVEVADGEERISENFGIDYHYETERSSGWIYEVIVGFDHIKTPSNEKIAEPAAEFTTRGPLSRVVTADSSILYSLRIQDPLELETEWSREARFTAGLNWSTSRVFSVLPRIDYLYEDIQGQDVPDRKDRTAVFRIDTRWTPVSTWILEMGAVFEDRESTEKVYELSEGRLELSVSSTIR